MSYFAPISQLATEKDAAKVKEAVEVLGVPVTDIFIPEYGGPYLPPSDGDRKFLHLKMANGKEFNVGLLKYTIERFPTSWIQMFAAELFAKSPFAE